MDSSKTGSGRRRWTSKQRQRLLARFHQSQLTQRDFATRHGVGLSTLSKWLRVEREARSRHGKVSGSACCPTQPQRWRGGSRQPARLDRAAAKQFEMCRPCPNCCRRCHADVSPARRGCWSPPRRWICAAVSIGFTVWSWSNSKAIRCLGICSYSPIGDGIGSRCFTGTGRFMGLCQAIGTGTVHLAGE